MTAEALLAWSSGKDSALAFHDLSAGGQFRVRALLTTVTADFQRISLHGVRRELLAAQADALGLGLEEVAIPAGASSETYERAMGEVLARQHAAGVRHVAFGDLFLADVRAHREANLARAGMTGLFPLWGQNTADLARRMIALGFRAVLTCVDTRALDASFAGRAFDESLLADLPAGVDPCGENGEFHTFVHDGPIFRHPIACHTGPTHTPDGRFCFRDVLPGA